MTNTLGDLGERRLLREVIPNYVAGAGDDCAFVGCANGTLVITTDPVPQPAAQVIGGDPDLYWLGWLLVTINASDIAASGARPVAFVAALDLPRHLEVNKLERLLKGIRDSCDANGLDYVGGNLREADKIGAVGTAIGSAESNPLRRKGAAAGDLVVVIGRGGRFWADVARLKAGSFIERSTSPIFAPVSQAKYICVVNALGLLRCAMDTSDGLAPTLSELALVNDLGIEIDLAAVRSAANYSDVTERPERLWMGWGDWTVVAAVSPMHLPKLSSNLESIGSTCSCIGLFSSGTKGVMLVDGDRQLPMGRLESERFAIDSWFARGVEEYMKRLYSFELP